MIDVSGVLNVTGNITSSVARWSVSQDALYWHRLMLSIQLNMRCVTDVCLTTIEQRNNSIIAELEIRSAERGICPIAALNITN